MGESKIKEVDRVKFEEDVRLCKIAIEPILKSYNLDIAAYIYSAPNAIIAAPRFIRREYKADEKSQLEPVIHENA